MVRKIEKIIIHCSDSKFGTPKVINAWHVERGFSEIGYHYVIGNGYMGNSKKYYEDYDGFIDDGRDVKKIGSHCKGQNSHSIGVCLIGKESFTEQQFRSLETLIYALMEEYNLGEDDVWAHYEFDDSKTCPCFNVREWLNSLQVKG